MAKKRKERDEAARHADTINVDAGDEAIPDAEKGRRFDATGFKRLHPKPALDTGASGGGDTELWLLQLPFDCQLPEDAEIRVERGDGGALRMTCTAANGTTLASVDGAMAEYGGALYATPSFSAAGAEGGNAPRKFDRVVTFADARYSRYLPAPASHAAAATTLPISGAAGGAAAGAVAAAAAGIDGDGGSKKKKKKDRSKDKAAAAAAGDAGEDGSKMKKKKDKHKHKKDKSRADAIAA